MFHVLKGPKSQIASQHQHVRPKQTCQHASHTSPEKIPSISPSSLFSCSLRQFLEAIHMETLFCVNVHALHYFGRLSTLIR